MESKIFKNMKHTNIECPECNWKRKQRKKQEKYKTALINLGIDLNSDFAFFNLHFTFKFSFPIF